MAPANYDFLNSGGAPRDQPEFSRNVVSNISNNVDGDEAGMLIYYPPTNTVEIVDP